MQAATLESVESAFCTWRLQRKNQSTPIPSELWSMAVGLYPHHTRSTICASLRLNGGQLKRRLETGSSAASEGFVVAYKSKEASPAMPAAEREVKLTLQGKERALMFCVDVPTFCHILPHLGAML